MVGEPAVEGHPQKRGQKALRHTNPATIDKAARTLLRLKDKTTRQRAANLTALLVITPTGPAYRRPDSVQIAPITALAP